MGEGGESNGRQKHIKEIEGEGFDVVCNVAYLYGMETVAVTERQQQRLQVCENNWVMRIAGVKRVEEGGMNRGRRSVCR